MTQGNQTGNASGLEQRVGQPTTGYEVFRFKEVQPGNPLIAHTLVMGYTEYNRGQGKEFPFLPLLPTEEIINVTNLANAHEALSHPAEYYGYLDHDVPDWIRRCEPHISQYLHQKPFTDDHLKGLDDLLSQPTQETIEIARKVSGMLDNQDYRRRVVESLKDFSFVNVEYAVNALREMNAFNEDVVRYLTEKAKERLGSGNLKLYKGAVPVLNALGINLQTVVEIRYAQDNFYKQFGKLEQPYELLWQMMGEGIGLDGNRMLSIAKQRFVEDKKPYAAAIMAESMKMMGYDIGRDMSEVAEIAVRRSRGTLDNTGLRWKPISRKDNGRLKKLKERIRMELGG